MANEYLKRKPTSTGNRKVFTLAMWLKRGPVISDSQTDVLFCAENTASSSHGTDIRFRKDNTASTGWNFYDYVSGSFNWVKYGTVERRDPAAWFHVMFVFDSTSRPNDEKVKVYFNGQLDNEVHPSTNTNPSDNYETYVNSLTNHFIGADTFAGSLTNYSKCSFSDVFLVDGQALTPEVFGFHKDGNGYISVGSSQTTDYKNGQWVPRRPREIKKLINDGGGFGVNGFYLPMNDSSNFGADFHCDPNSIITLKGENDPQPRNGAPGITTNAYVDKLRSDPYAANLVLAMPLIVGGQDNGYGDYSADIKGSGTNKTVTATGSPSISGINSSLYYGSALVDYNSLSDYLTVSGSGNDFRLDPSQEDWTIELWTNPYARSTPRHTSILLKGDATTNNNFDWRIYVGDASSIDNDLSFGIGGYTGDSVEGNGNQINLPSDQWHHVCIEAHNGILTKYLNGVAVGINTNPGSQTTNYSDIVIARADLGGAGDVGYVGAISDIRIYSGVAKYKGGFDVPKPYTPVGIATWRAVSDTCLNTFCTWNPLWKSTSNNTFSKGNLMVNDSGSSGGQGSATIGITTGKYYWEVRATNNPYSGSVLIGVRPTDFPTYNTQNRSSYRSSGHIYRDNGTQAQLDTSSYDDGDIIGVAFDANNRELHFSKNGVWIDGADPSNSSGGNISLASTFRTYTPSFAFDNGSGDEILDANWGQNPTFGGTESTPGEYSDENGIGLFKYPVPSGYLSLCTNNLPVLVKDPGKHFKTVLWEGTGASTHVTKITGVGFKPDFVWIKNRSNGGTSYYHNLYDSVRSMGKLVNTTADAAETSFDGYGVQSFDDDGFSLIGNGTLSNQGGDRLVAWCWKAGGPAVRNNDGDVTSRVSVNQEAGFSIVNYGGQGYDNVTIGSGLNGTLQLVLIKRLSSTADWIVGGELIGENKYMVLNSDGVPATASTLFRKAHPGTGLFEVGTGTAVNQVSSDYIAYCWTEIEGYSKFGKYKGSGSDDDAFIYCGFKPAFVMIKNITSSSDQSWAIYDTARDSTNPLVTDLAANSNLAEGEKAPNYKLDFVSNGIKLKYHMNWMSLNNNDHIFMAFAESPFQTANAK